jgi:hypothetical protein
MNNSRAAGALESLRRYIAFKSNGTNNSVLFLLDFAQSELKLKVNKEISLDEA